jgi:putative hydrolase of the HAD superfamily
VIARTAARLELDAAELDAMLSPIGERMAPIEATVDLLAELRQRRDEAGDIRLFYLSNMPAPYARVLQERHEFIQWFDGGIFSGDVQLAKPQPEIFQLLAARHGLQPGRTVFIDDMPYNVDAAAALGWHGIRFETPEGLREQLSSLI